MIKKVGGLLKCKLFLVKIMNKLNISRQAVYNNKNKALKNLRKMLEQ